MAVTLSSANHDVDYVEKDFNSSIDALINFATVNFGANTSANRLWTSFNLDSFSRNWLEIVSYIADVFFFYFDSQATQSYLQTATLQSAVEDIAKQFGYTPATATSASGSISLTLSSAGTVARGFRFSDSAGTQFYLIADVTAGSAGTYTGSVIQGTVKSEQFTSVGLQTEQFDLQGPNVVRDLIAGNPLDRSPQVVVNGNSYTLVTSFIHSNGTDTAAVLDSLGNVIGGGGRVFTLATRPNGTPYITFGDGVFGRKLVAGELITVSYRTGGGTVGNIPAQSLVNLVDSNPILTSVTNTAAFSGGADAQTIDQLRQLIPASLRTLDRAVAEQDYTDLLLATFTEIIAASTERNTTDAGIDINVYVVPTGLGIPKITDNTVLRDTLSSFLDRRKMVTIQFQILDAFGIDILIGLKVHIADTASKSAVSQAISTALQNYFNITTGGDSGTGIGFAAEVLSEKLTDIITAVTGVTRFEFTKLTYRPRIQTNVRGITTTYATSPVEIFKNVSESEWLLGAAGPVTRIAGTVLFTNTTLTGFTYNSGSGLITYAFPVDLLAAAPGDQFRDGASVDYTILGVDTVASTLYITPGLSVNTTVTTSDHGSIRSGSTTFQSYKVFKKFNAEATNLSIDSITDNNMDLSVLTGTGAALTPRVLLDNSQVFVINQFATGDFYLVDAASNLWEIVSNSSSTLTTSITAVNDASITSVASGAYKIVTKLVGAQVVFNTNIFNIQYNSDKTIFSTGAQFSNIGTIGDAFQVSRVQTNLGNLGQAIDIVSYDSSTKTVTLNDSPDLTGITADYYLVDSTGQIFNVTAVDDRALPSTFYEDTNQDSSYIIQNGLGQQYAQGFKVPSNNVYSVVSFNLKKEGNILGSLTAKIVNDDGTGLPNLSSIVATSQSVAVSSLSESFGKVVFSFTTPPSLNSISQYHLVISGDASYYTAQQDDIAKFTNTGLVGFTYNSLSGVVQYASAVNLSAVIPGNYLKDGIGNFFKILAVDDSSDRVTLDVGLSVDNTVSTSDNGAIYAKDNVYVGADSSSPTYADGVFARFDGSTWANDTQGPILNRFSGPVDGIFSVEGPKTIKVTSSLTPVTGPGATLSSRYYDDEQEISLILGISGGLPTFASDVNPIGIGTVNTVPNSKVDSFVFRTSRYAEDIINIRFNEIPELTASNIEIEVFGGVQ